MTTTKEGAAPTTKKRKAPASKSTKGGATTTKKRTTTKRKKPAVKKDDGEILAAGQAAAADLAAQRAAAAASRLDPLWYRTIDCALTPAAQAQIPVVEQCLQQQGLTPQEVTPQAMACLLEEAVRYSQQLMEAARECAAAAGRADMVKADVTLAQELTGNQPSTTHTTPRLLWVSQQVNRRPLPTIPSHCCNGVVIGRPLQRTWDLVSASAATVERTVPQAPPTKKKDAVPGYGAVKAKNQIPVKLQAKSSTGDTSSKTS